jgi:hypothetical protein
MPALRKPQIEGVMTARSAAVHRVHSVQVLEILEMEC